ncbi:MAG: peptide chain release factor N(5)-glutamine methyltransferase [Clostridia bacterium]|nr:peptide chain release factor N(5)-glutamine methyltransferase [Clostridia bacterium]
MSLPIKELLNIGKVQLEESGVMDAAIDAKALYCFMKDMDSKQFLLNWQFEAQDDDCERYFQLIDLRSSGVPLQHITEKQSFMGYEFKVNEKVLIPRQDTETMVEDAIDLIEKGSIRGEAYQEKKNWEVLDLCTGSGAIAISLFKECKNVKKMSASDVSQDALDVARENARNLGAEKVNFLNSDLFDGFKGRLKKSKFDLIISNPPYIRSDVIPTLQREVRDHEPMLALDGGADGLDFYRRIVKEAPEFLKADGILMMEIGYDQGSDLLALMAEDFDQVKCLKDLAGKDRIIIGKLKKRA